MRALAPISLLVLGCAGGTPRGAAPTGQPNARPPLTAGTATPRARPTATTPPPAALPATADTATIALAEVADDIPLTLVEVGRSGRFMVTCAARADTDKSGSVEVSVGSGGALGGDALVPELVLGGAAPEPIDDLFGVDPEGRYVVVRRGERILLLDAASRSATDLGGLGFDARDDVLDYRSHRSLAFDPRGEILAYVRRGEAPGVVLRTLASGEERIVTGLPGEPWRLTWDGRGDNLVLAVVSEDTTKNGKLEFPARLAKGPRVRCQGPIPRFHVSGDAGDKPVSFVVRRDGQGLARAPELALPFGSSLVTRNADGALFEERGASRIPLASAECAGRVLHSDVERNLLLVACTGGKNPQKASVELVGAGRRQVLGLELQPLALDRYPEPSVRLVPLYPGADTVLVDLAQRRTLTLKPGDRVLTTLGARAFLLRKNALVVFDADSASERTLIADTGRYPRTLVELPFAVVGSLVLDLAAERVLGSFSGRPLALTRAGEVLVAEGRGPSPDAVLRGPLGYHRPGALTPANRMR
jgi:hypothetical protein